MILLAANQIAKLEGLGFNQADCVSALEATDGQVNEAASWLLENATPESPKPKTNQQGLEISGFEVGHFLCHMLMHFIVLP